MADTFSLKVRSSNFGLRCKPRGQRRWAAMRPTPLASRLASALPASYEGSVICTFFTAPLHSKPGHPEGPERVEVILNRMRNHQWPGPTTSATAQPLLSTTAAASLSTLSPSRFSSTSSSLLFGRLRLLESHRSATVEELALVHPPAYVEAIQAACRKIREPTLVDDSTYLAPGSYDDCSRSVGAVLNALDALLSPHGAYEDDDHGGSGAGRGHGSTVPQSSVKAPSSLPSSSSSVPPRQQASAAFAFVRPPGHHVLSRRPMGFGVFNTVSLAARYARERYGIDKIAIVDFDVHHGNGTMEVFYDDPYTLYVSTHQAGLWPYTGKARDTGAGAGRGATLNIPLPGGSGDQAMRLTWSQLVLPSLESFRPQLLLVSAGYDAHWRDPLAGMQLTCATYHRMCSELLALSRRSCPGRLALILEGGYDTASLSDSVVASLEGLLGLPSTSIKAPATKDLYDEPLTRVAGVLQEVRKAHGL